MGGETMEHLSHESWAQRVLRNASNKPAGTACLFYKDPAVADKVTGCGVDFAALQNFQNPNVTA
jgi:hypothetical protein